MSWDDVNRSILPEIPGWPKKFRNNSRITFAREMSEVDARWWQKTFVDTHGLYPEDVAEKLVGDAPGQRTISFDMIDPLDESFAVTIEGADMNRRVWFQASELRIRDGLIYQDRMDVEAEFRGRKTTQKLMRGVAEFADLMGCRRIVLDAQEIGGYLWATAGCLPIGSWIGIRNDILPRLGRLQARREISPERVNQITRMLAAGEDDPRLLWAIARLPDEVTSSHRRSIGDPATISLGKELLIGVRWKGEIDMDSRFSRTVFRKWLRK
jgi:GNAT superfamily N-acetyltransferase